MQASESLTVKEARRVMEVCNACRYCGGFCAVFPAMEKRRSFPREDLEYLANLCHNCTACFHACQYAPPQEFGINNSRVMAQLRAETYEKYAWPGFLAKLFRRNGLAVSLITATAVAVILLLTIVLQGPGVVFSVHQGPNAFYQVVPYGLMVGVPVVIALFVLLAMFMGLLRFSRGIGWPLRRLANLRSLGSAIWNVLSLRYLGGSGDGCNCENDAFSHKRRRLHQTVFYGFMLCLVSTTVAAFYDHFLQWPAPYPYFSIPVATGTLGGLGLMIGSAGLLWLKVSRDQRPMAREQDGMDVAFGMLLFLSSFSGLILMILRETAAMGFLLAVHLGFVAAFFLVIPYSKFVHVTYRFLALARFAAEGPYRSKH